MTAGGATGGITTRGGSGCAVRGGNGDGRGGVSVVGDAAAVTPDDAGVDGGAVTCGFSTGGRGSSCGGGLGITSVDRGGTAGGCDTTGASDAGRDGTVDAGGCGVDKAGFDVDAVPGPWAIVRVGATGAGFFGVDGASRKISNDKPTKPTVTAAPPNRSIVFNGTAPPEVERG